MDVGDGCFRPRDIISCLTRRLAPLWQLTRKSFASETCRASARKRLYYNVIMHLAGYNVVVLARGIHYQPDNGG